MNTDSNLAPICLFTYNRLFETKQTIGALKKNSLSESSELYVFSDGAKDKDSIEKVSQVRAYLNTVTGFNSITIKEASVNKGLARSIIDGVSEVLKSFDSVIVLEDDLITSENFLDFMNQALLYYKNNTSVFSISGYSMSLPSLEKYDKDYYAGVRASSWGWATWKRSWVDIDWEIKDYRTFSKSLKQKREFNKGGSDMSRMLRNQMNNKIDSWAIRWCFNQFIRKQYTIFPKVSKVCSIGFGENATHTKRVKRFDTVLDISNNTSFSFENQMVEDERLLKEFKNKFSLLSRIKDRL